MSGSGGYDVTLSNGRRRFLAAFSAAGMASLAGLRPARADTAPCSVSHEGGTAEGEHNYMINASLGQFSFLTAIEAIGEEIVLYDAQAAIGRKTAVAAVKGRMERRENGTIGVKLVSFEFPLTALERDGNFYGIVQMAHEQDASVGLSFSSGAAHIGGFSMLKDEFAPNTTNQGFEGNAALTLYDSLTSDVPFKAELVAGSDPYSAITVDTAAFKAFIEGTVIAEMERMKQMDATSPCAVSFDSLLDDEDGYGYLGCFLTGACCAVVGLPDDCWELTTLRRFRDGWMSGFAAGRADIARYYAEAPALARRLLASGAGRRRLLGLYWRVIVPSALCARLGLNGLAYRLYRRMMVGLLA
jgi:hypothetical protein